ncbi:MAG TPA: hypothetical protein VI382_01095 [Candidatus Manganitrophaceae bacterium]|nr:hypothetical protein [Candidatus Manganitrophaceae bacterium]
MVFEIHHIEGFDPQRRMFNRDVPIEVDEEGYSAQFRYEGFSVQSGVYPTVDEALSDLTKKLLKKGYAELRTRVNFREDRYLAEREPWIYYKAS